MSENRYETQGLDAFHISSNLNNYEAARSGFFTFIVDKKLDSLVKASYKGNPEEASDNDKISNIQETLKLNVVKCDIPQYTSDVLSFRRGNDVVKFSGVPTLSSGTIVVDDLVGLNTKGILHAWRNKVYNIKTQKGGRMKDYKFNCTLIEYTQDYEPIRQWKLVGCWPSSLSEDSFDKENDGKRQISATIEYDRAIPQEIGEI